MVRLYLLLLTIIMLSKRSMCKFTIKKYGVEVVIKIDGSLLHEKLLEKLR